MSSVTTPDDTVSSHATRPVRRRPPVTPTQRAVRIGVLIGFWLFAMCVTLIVLGSSKVPANASVAGVDIGGLDREGAVNKLTAAFGQRTDAPIMLKIDGATTRVPATALGLSVDYEATVDSAMTSKWNPFDVVREVRGSGPTNVVFAVDETAMEAKLDALARQFSQSVQEAEITYTGTTPELSEPVSGRTIDKAAAPGVLMPELLNTDKPIVLPIQEQAPTVSRDEAREVLDGLAKTAVSAPVLVKVGEVSAEASPTAIAAALTFRVRDGELRPVIDGASLHAALAPALAQVDSPAKDARWDVSSGQPVLVPHVLGNGVTDGHVADSVGSVLDKQGDQRRVEMPLGPLTPELTTDEAAALNVKEKVSSFTQRFPYQAYRKQNIGQVAKKVNNTLLKPGETFSFNEIVGERTKANGFTKGLVVGEGGRFQEDMGGGVSAAATTLWTAAFFAGLERVEQGSHLIWISRYRPGLEATVAWGQLDLKFRNNTPAGLLITTKMTDTSLRVTMWGEKQYDEVRAVSGPKVNTTPFEKQEVSGPGCVPQGGVPGFSIDVDRVFFKAGERVKEETFTTSYIPAAQVTCVKDPTPSEPAPKPSAANASTGR